MARRTPALHLLVLLSVLLGLFPAALPTQAAPLRQGPPTPSAAPSQQQGPTRPEDLSPPAPVPLQLPTSQIAQAPIGKLASAAATSATLTRLPLAFEPNMGQTDSAVRFQVRGLGGMIHFAEDETVLTLPGRQRGQNADAANRRNTPPTASNTLTATDVISYHVLRQHFLGADPHPVVTGTTALPGKVNYFTGSDRTNWRIGIPTYAGIAYKDLYPGIDLQYDGNEGHLKRTFVVAPGADPSRIRWRYQGAEKPEVDGAGRLLVTLKRSANQSLTETLTLTETAPIAWQVINQQRVSVDVRFVVEASGQVGFAVAPYDHTQPLIIDPTLEYGSYLGGSGSDYVADIDADNDGNVYVIGTTRSTNFPPATTETITGTASFDDVFVVKLNAVGDTLLYRTFLRGSGGSNSDDEGAGIVVDRVGGRAGQAWITGHTWSANFPLVSALFGSKPGRADVFVTKLDVQGGLLFSTYLGGDANDFGTDIALDPNGNAYTTGRTISKGVLSSTNIPFPTKPSLPKSDSSFDAFVTKIKNDGSEVVYSRYIGGNGSLDGDYGQGLVVDADEMVTLTGYTEASDFPIAGGFQTARAGGTDAFITRLNTDGSIASSSFLGGLGNDYAYGIARDLETGHVFVVGQISGTLSSATSSFGLPTTNSTNAFVARASFNSSGSASLQYLSILGGSNSEVFYRVAVDAAGQAIAIGETKSSAYPLVDRLPHSSSTVDAQDAVVSMLTPTGSQLVFSTFLDSTSAVDDGRAVAIDPVTGHIVVASYRGSIPTTAGSLQPSGAGLVDINLMKLSTPRLYLDQERVAASCQSECTVHTGKPVHTLSGNFWTKSTDLAVQTPGPALVWQRTYISQATDEITGSLGVGWLHPYATQLITPSMAQGEPNTVIVLAPQGNRLRFRQSGSSFTPVPGVYSSLVQDITGYTWTLRDQTAYRFGLDGTLASIRDPQGQQVTLGYSGSPARLTSIVDAADATRALQLTYHPDGHIATVSDGVRSVGYSYTGDDLTGVRDVMQRWTFFSYQNHLLTRIRTPLDETIEAMSYDVATPEGRVISQTLRGGRQFLFSYHTPGFGAAQSTIITTTEAGAPQSVTQYDYGTNNALLGVRHNGQAVAASTFDDGFAPAAVSDGRGNTTQVVNTSVGLPTQITNALNQKTQVSYDSNHNPLAITDAQGITTRLRYDSANNVISTTVGITTSLPLGATTLYTYTLHPRSGTLSLLEATRAPDGVVTRFGYNDAGQVLTQTVGYNTPLAQVTTYGYDSLGRLNSTTVGVGTPQQRRTVTIYNADNTVQETIQNYVNGSYTPSQPDEDIRTRYGYDDFGNLSWVTDVSGRLDATQYNTYGQVAWTIRNLQPVILNTNGEPVVPATPPAFNPAYPDRNVATLYGYDGLGRTVLVTETGLLTGVFSPTTRRFSDHTTRVSHTQYDSLDRPITVTLNYQPSNVADANFQTVMTYDGAGNLTGQRDSYGRWSSTTFDALNRPVTVTVNLEDGNPLTGASDTDRVSVTRYDASGRVAETVSNYADGVFNADEPDRDRITRYQYDSLGRVITTTQNLMANPGSRTDVNLTTVNAYDPVTTRLLAQQDPLGRWQHTQYDVLGRATTQIANCVNSGGAAVPTGCAPVSEALPDRNLPTSYAYDALGQTTLITNALDIATGTIYDGLGRSVAQIANFKPGSSSLPDRNVTTGQVYDGLGRTLILTDAVGATVQRQYDALGRTVVMTDAVGRATRIGYDGLGQQRWVERADGQLTVLTLDRLGRQVATTLNYQDGSVDANEPSDQDLIQQTAYDRAGRVTQILDASERQTWFGYDALNRLTLVRENVTGSCGGGACSFGGTFTHYGYDWAGNRTSIEDARERIRTFAYDAANRMVSATDALSQTTSWSYDKGGRRLSQDDPRGAAFDLSWAYDGQDRVISTTAVQLSAPITATYDALGRRTTLHDATGITGFGYDNLGRLTTLNAPESGQVAYSYSARGQRSELVYPSGLTLSYGYLPDGQLQSITQTDDLLASYSYDSVGRLDTLSRANGATTSYSYDDADRLARLQTTVGIATRSQFDYAVDRLGQRTAVTETLGSATRVITYAYDGWLRLTEAVESPGTHFEYAYDDAGNRTGAWVNGVQTESRSYNAANQVVGWTYDAAGNLTSDGTRSYSYDALNRQLSATQGLTTTRYGYNGDGVLITATVGSGLETRYIQDQSAPLSQILQAKQGTTTTSYLYGHARLASLTGSTRSWELADALGSVRGTLDEAGVLLDSVNYDPWGQVQSGSPAPFGFTGELHEAASGLVHLRARWYNPQSGTLTSRDPYWGQPTRPDTLHPYTYVGNNPLLRTDPSGRCYPPVEFLRTAEPQNCHNLDLAYEIAGHPNASFWEQAAANVYIGTFWGSHQMLAAGTAVLAGAAIGAGAAVVGGAASTVGTTVVGAVGAVGATATGLAQRASASLVASPNTASTLSVVNAGVQLGVTGYTIKEAFCGNQDAQALLANPYGVTGINAWSELGNAIYAGWRGYSSLTMPVEAVGAATTGAVSRFKSTDVDAFKQFLTEAAAAQSQRNVPALTGYWNRALEDVNNLYVYRIGDRIVGAIQVGKEAGALEVKLLQSIQPGVGTELMRQAVRTSIEQGYQGRLILTSYPESVDFYKKLGGELVDPDFRTFVWGEEAAQALLSGR
jgi:RHS repeat-associated protein